MFPPIANKNIAASFTGFTALETRIPASLVILISGVRDWKCWFDSSVAGQSQKRRRRRQLATGVWVNNLASKVCWFQYRWVL
jgi:hypothetical protein